MNRRKRSRGIEHLIEDGQNCGLVVCFDSDSTGLLVFHAKRKRGLPSQLRIKSIDICQLSKQPRPPQPMLMWRPFESKQYWYDNHMEMMPIARGSTKIDVIEPTRVKREVVKRLVLASMRGPHCVPEEHRYNAALLMSLIPFTRDLPTELLLHVLKFIDVQQECIRQIRNDRAR
jgi:hypothetical protein